MTRLDELRALAKAPTVDWLDRLDEHCKGVAAVMTEIHGGRYNVVIEHEVRLVMVVPILGPNAG
jgi:hypothetical protein